MDGKELEANRTILDASSSSSVSTNGSVTDHMQKGIQNILILQSCPPSSTVGQQSGGSVAAVDDHAQKCIAVPTSWSRKRHEGHKGGVTVDGIYLAFDYICL
jgi:hypothetical protein